ncbi:hypothetical protein B5G09_11060 [Alistipes sp. An54]|uniref:DUF262 domain-containing protein n=1 Tax=Alistipes sp. An54 TaxID=1965645 RepID=UPI000B39C729|nr:DUF262 domain-containing protein [Alistipes sp. An54]OUN76191.1 hypothetical protein B5G09_11060 [Alistipes sp. An54]
MRTTQLHTFEEVLTEGIHVDNESEPIKVSCIFIPKIQRSYAQGRSRENEIRSDFLKEIFTSLTDNNENTTPLELGFLFGSKQPLVNGSGEGLELLDGQQRATTLFLLYWYIYQQEASEVPKYLSRFTYETRDTSTQFLLKITSTKFDLKTEKPSEVLKANKWFTDDFNCDATVCAMLNMLDDIDTLYKGHKLGNIHERLNRIQFYVLLLDQFDMTDELYIKMNSRGLRLTPFENFKASIVKYMKSTCPAGVYGMDLPVQGKMPFWLEFISNIDAQWIDIFWQNPLKISELDEIKNIITINDKEIGDRYFRFFNRYFFTKATLLEGNNTTIASLQSFFYNDVEQNTVERKLEGWENYENLFQMISQQQREEVFPVFGPIKRVLNVFLSHYETICNVIRKAPYGGVFDFDVRNKENYLLSHRVVFAFITEFIEAIPQNKNFDDGIVRENFKKMLRVVLNIIENTAIENIITLTGVIKTVHEIIHLPDAIGKDFYQSLASADLQSKNRQLIEEQEKVQEMFDSQGNYDQSWEQAFIEAESHPFFKGSVRFFFTPKHGTSRNFQDRYQIVKDLFDKNGIALSYRKNKRHILIRALLSCLNQWNPSGMQDRYFTENAETEKYLKNILTGSPAIRKMFCHYFDTPNNKSIDQYLEDVVKQASCLSNETNESFKMLYNRLITDSRAEYIYDWISNRESERKSCFRIQNNRSYIVAIPGKWYDRIVLDTERHIIIPELISLLEFKYSDTNQAASMEGPMKDSWGWQIRIEKEILSGSERYILELNFDEWKHVNFFIYGNIQRLSPFSKVWSRVDGGVKVDSLPYQFYKDKQPILDKIREIEIGIKSGI